MWLERRWGTTEDYVLHIGMNPSYAGADSDDLTVRKDQEFTRRMGLSRMIKCNVGTYISTDPGGLSHHGIVVSHPDNLAVIRDIAEKASRIVVATGDVPDILKSHARAVFQGLKSRGHKMECFGLTASHWPKHSSRLSYATPLVEFVW